MVLGEKESATTANIKTLLSRIWVGVLGCTRVMKWNSLVCDLEGGWLERRLGNVAGKTSFSKAWRRTTIWKDSSTTQTDICDLRSRCGLS